VSTGVGLRAPAGVVLARDRTHVEAGTVVGAAERTLDLEYAGAVAVGRPGDVEAFYRRLTADLDRYRTDHGEDPTVEVVARSAARLAGETGVEAVVAGRDEGSTPRIRSVRSDGSVLETDAAAVGSGAEAALARLDRAEVEGDLADVVAVVREVLTDVGERDPGTGGGVDVTTLPGR